MSDPMTAQEVPAAANVSADGGAQSETVQQRPEPKRESGRNSARNDVLAAMEELEGKAAASEEKTKGDGAPREQTQTKSEAKPGEPQRGADGKFVKAGEASPENAQAQPAQAAQPQPLNAPASWKGAGKINWGRLSPEIQQEIISDHKIRAELEQKFAPLQQVLAPREAALVAQYGGVGQALQQLFALSDFASQRPAEFINWFAQSRQINLQQPAQQQQQPGQQFAGQQAHAAASLQNIPPELAPLVSELNGIKSFLSQQQQAATLAEQQAIAEVSRKASADVQALVSDSAKYPYANDVRMEMAALFQSGQAKTLDEAYNKAVYMNDAVRERVVQDRTNAELEKRAAAAAEKKNAAVSVSGSPGGQQGAGNGNRRSTVRDDVIAAAAQIGFGGVARL